MKEGSANKRKRHDCCQEIEFGEHEPGIEEKEKIEQKSERNPLAIERNFAITTEIEVNSAIKIVTPPIVNPAVEKVFNAISVPLSEIIDYLPHIQWLHLQRVNKFTKTIVVKKLRCLKMFRHDWRSNHDNFEKIYLGLRVLAPNLEELPKHLETHIILGGFDRLRKITLFHLPFSGLLSWMSSANPKVHFTQVDSFLVPYVAEIRRRAATLQSLQLKSSVVPVNHLQITYPYWRSGAYFPQLKKLDMSASSADFPFTSPEFVSVFPALEDISMPSYKFKNDYDTMMTFKNDMDTISELRNLKKLSVSYSHIRYDFVVLPIPTLTKIVFHYAVNDRDVPCWRKFFFESPVLRAVDCIIHAGASDFLVLLVAIPELRELRINYHYSSEELIKFLSNRCLKTLRILELSIDFCHIEHAMEACNENLEFLETLRIDNDIQRIVIDEASARCRWVKIHLPRLKILCISFWGDVPSKETIVFEASPDLKSSLEHLEIRKNVGSIDVPIDPLVTDFLNGCESLVKFQFHGFTDGEKLRQKISELGLPKLRLIELS